jgi:hypothetical protein
MFDKRFIFRLVDLNVNKALTCLNTRIPAYIRKAMKFVQLKTVRDLVMLVASSPATNVIQHLENGGKHVYFVIGGTLSEVFTYLVKLEEPIKGSFITYNSYKGEIGSSEKIASEPNMNSFPIIEIMNQNLIPEEMLETVAGL